MMGMPRADLLIVDDERDIRESLAEFFAEEGFTVSVAADGAEALEALRTGEPPRVVILDLVMPVLSGNEVYERMQADPRLTDTPVIVSTSDPARAPSGLLIMKKPVNLDRLLLAVRNYCAPAPR
jgi:two-component system, sensor histidine kinase and response regulator